MSDNNHESADDAQQKNNSSPRSTSSSGFIDIFDLCEKSFNGERVREDPEIPERIDKFCCTQSSEKYPSLRTTYKAVCKKNKYNRTLHNCRTIVKESTFLTRMDQMVQSKSVPFICYVRKTDQQTMNNLMRNISYSDLENTTCQSAQFSGKEKMQSVTVSLQSGSQYRKKSRPEELTKRYRPGCKGGTIRDESQNCTDNSGTILSNNYFDYLDTRRINLMSPSSTADEQLKEKLTDIRQKVWDIQAQLEAADFKIIRFIQKINIAKRPGNNFKMFQREEPILCILCGKRVQTQYVESHLKHCYKRYENKSLITGCTVMHHDAIWNVFCDHKSTRRSRCKNLKALCRLHGKYFRKDDEVCGYELARNVYCGSVGNTCGHVNWEVLKRAQLDIEKLSLIVKLTQLNQEERKIENEMASRGDLTV